jgi:hemin uptake protein HemP
MTTVSLPARSEHVPSSQDPRHRAASLPEVESVRLLQGQRELLIRHGNECYRLRHTRNDKLILTK